MAMIGPAVGRQDRLFYEFDLEERMPHDSFVAPDRCRSRSELVRADLAPFYSHTGCPSVDPELMVRMRLIGYCSSIRSERRLCREVELNLACRWFCRLGLEDQVPHHSTFSVNRHGRFRASDVLRQVFESIVRRCMATGLVAGEGFALDASVIEAHASRCQRVEGGEVAWTDAQRASRPVRAYLAALDGEHAPTNPERKPKALSPAAWTTRGRHKVMFGYSLNYLIDLANAIIVDVEATPTRISKEVDATATMLERTVARFALAPDHLAADVAYGTGAMLGWLVGHGIDPHIPVWDQSEVSANGKFPRADFAYDHARDLYICPGGKELKTSGTVHDGTTIKYLAKRSDCAVCPLKRHCTTGLERRLARDVHQDARDYAQALMQTEAYRVSRSARKKIETLFGDAKHNLALVRLRLRGLSGARDEFLLTAAVQNLKRLAVHATRPPPQLRTA
jgi:transposase